MSVFDDLKAKADANGDGKVDAADLQSLEGKIPTDKLNELKAKADANGDGKVDLADLSGLQEMASSVTSNAGGLFGKLTSMFKK